MDGRERSSAFGFSSNDWARRVLYCPENIKLVEAGSGYGRTGCAH